MTTRILIVLLAALLAGAALADAPVYKWVDKQGHVHYGTTPPDMNMQPLNIVNTAGALGAETGAPPAATAANPAAQDAQLTKATPGDSAACQAAREVLARYLNASFLYILGPDGKQKKLSADQQQQALANARANVTQSCTPAGGPS